MWRTVGTMRVLGQQISPDSTIVRLIAAAVITILAIVAFLSRSEDVVSWVFLSPTVAAAWWWACTDGRVAAPMQLFGIVFPVVLNLIESSAEVSMFISVIVTVQMAASVRNRTLLPPVLGLHIFLVALFGITDAINDFAWQNWVFGLAFAWGAGELVWRLTETVDELEETRAMVADQAAIQERRRIARDVHDLVGHSLTVVMLHVAGARHVLHDDPDEAERALAQAEDSARQSLAEIRRTVGLLRDEGDVTPEILPSAGLMDLPNLIDEFLLAGRDVDLDLRGPIALPEPAVGVAAYRIVQEALTNVSRHAPGASATVTVVVDDASCEIVVRNTPGLVPSESLGSGFGLVSMRERARSVGGSLLAGPADGGWLVEASLPLRVEARR